MKKSVISMCMALLTAMSMNAESFTGTLSVNANGTVNNSTTTINVTENGNGLYTISLEAPEYGTLTLTDVKATTANGITVYSADRTVNTSMGNTDITLLARSTNGMMTADLVMPSCTMRFDNVGNYFQLPNSDFETWTADNDEPDRWHGFMTAKGALASMASKGGKLTSSTDVRPGSSGLKSAMITTGRVMGVLANGTMTNGQLNAGGILANDTKNHAEMDKTSTTTDANGEKFYMPIYAKPDAFKTWIKYVQGTENADFKANLSVKAFDGTYYQEPVDKTYTNLSGSIVGGQIEACDWTEFTFPMDYDSYASNNAATEAIFVTFSTNATPGQGNDGDEVYIDDMELIYLASMTDLKYQGTTIEGWNPAVTTYNMQIEGEPNLDDFTATVEGASAVLTKSMEQNANGSYRIAISAVAADLQTATSYIINVTAPANVLIGDVDGDGNVTISDVTALIDYLLGGTANINEQNADIDNDGNIAISDVTALIDLLLSGN